MATARPPAPPTAPADIDTNREARDKYWDAMEQYYRDRGLSGKEADSRAKDDVNRLRKEAQYKLAAEKLTPEQRKRVDDQHRRIFGRAANNFELTFFNNKTDEEINRYLINSLEYQEKRGNLKVLQGRDSRQGQQVVIYDTAEGRALLENQDFLSFNFKNRDTVYTPKGYTDLKSKGDFDVWKERKEGTTKVTKEILDNNPWLQKAGYAVGDTITESTRVKKPKSGFFNWVDDAFGTNTARAWDKHVSGQIKAMLDPLGIYGGLVTRNTASDQVSGGAKLFGTSESKYLRGRAYANLAVDIALNFVPGVGQAILLAKKSIQSVNAYQSGEIKGKQLVVELGKNYALSKLAAVGQAANAGKTAQSVQTGSKIAQAAKTLSSTRGGMMAAQTAIAYAANRASGVKDSVALKEAAWSGLGAGTGGLSTGLRFATSKSAQNALRDPYTGEIDPIRVTQQLMGMYGQAKAALGHKGGYVGYLKENMSLTAWNPLGGAARLGETARSMYNTLAGQSYNVQQGYTYNPAVPSGVYQTSGITGIETKPVTDFKSFQSQNSGQLARNQYSSEGWSLPSGRQGPEAPWWNPTGAGETLTLTQRNLADPNLTRTTVVTQNALPSLRGLGNVGTELLNVAAFNRLRPATAIEPIRSRSDTWGFYPYSDTTVLGYDRRQTPQYGPRL